MLINQQHGFAIIRIMALINSPSLVKMSFWQINAPLSFKIDVVLRSCKRKAHKAFKVAKQQRLQQLGLGLALLSALNFELMVSALVRYVIY